MATILFPAKPGAQAIQRAMYVSVLNEADAPVTDLGVSDFVIREDGVAREGLRVAPANEAMQVAVLVDNSQAARDYIRDIRVGLESFVNEMTDGTKNEISIVGLAEGRAILADAAPERGAIVVITPEGPEFSPPRYEDVLKPVHEAGATLHAIVLGLPSNDISEEARNRGALLDE